MLKNYSLNRMIVLAVTAGFLFLMADTILEHKDILSKQWGACIPIIFSAIGFIIGLITVMKWDRQWIRYFQICLIAGCIVTVAGVYFHIPDSDEDENKENVQGQQENKEKEKPLLAPFAFAGMGAIGMLGALRKWNAEVEGV